MSDAAKLKLFGVVLALAACAAVVGCHSGRYRDDDVGDYMVYPETSGDYAGRPEISGGESDAGGVCVEFSESEEDSAIRQDSKLQKQGAALDDEGDAPSAEPKSPPSVKAKPQEPMTGGPVAPNDKSKIGHLGESQVGQGADAASDIGAKMRRFDSPEGKKTFRLGDDGTWRDDSCDPASKDAITVKYISDEYYNLLKAKPEVGDYVKLGEKIVVRIAGKTYVIEGITK